MQISSNFFEASWRVNLTSKFLWKLQYSMVISINKFQCSKIWWWPQYKENGRKINKSGKCKKRLETFFFNDTRSLKDAFTQFQSHTFHLPIAYVVAKNKEEVKLKEFVSLLEIRIKKPSEKFKLHSINK